MMQMMMSVIKLEVFVIFVPGTPDKVKEISEI
jgi:hypothetical protein